MSISLNEWNSCFCQASLTLIIVSQYSNSIYKPLTSIKPLSETCLKNDCNQPITRLYREGGRQPGQGQGLFLTQKMKPLLAKKGTLEDPSRIINIGSIDGLNVPGFPTFSYSTSKAAVHHLTRHLAAQLVSENITVNAIAPGPYPSAMLGSAVNSDYSEIEKHNPRKRTGSPEDIAGLTIFLCSRAGAYVVGETIASDGGLVKTAGHILG